MSLKTRLRWTSSETITLQSEDDLIRTFKLFKYRGVKCIYPDFEVLPLEMEFPKEILALCSSLSLVDESSQPAIDKIDEPSLNPLSIFNLN